MIALYGREMGLLVEEAPVIGNELGNERLDLITEQLATDDQLVSKSVINIAAEDIEG